MEYHDEQASQSIDCQDASVTTKVITQKGRQFDSSIEALLDALHDQYVTPTQHVSVDKSGDVLQRMTPNQEYKKLVQRVEKLEQEPMESEHDKAISCTSPNPLWATYLIRKVFFLNPLPISRSLDSNLHEFEFIPTSIAHIFMLFVGLFLPFWPFCMCAHYACSPKCYR